MESITQTSGRSRSSVAHTTSRFVSARISTCSAPPSRAARSFTCAVDSSPVTSRARRSREIAASAISSSVDFPTPGSPPTRTSEAGTSPPPSTRSSSGTPVGIRSASSTSTSARRSSGLASACPFAAGAACSASVPKLAQLGQRPSQRPVEYPHSEQEKCRAAAFAMPSSLGTRSDADCAETVTNARARSRAAPAAAVRSRR